MTIDMNDPKSIAAWFKACPQRHGPILRMWLRNAMWAQFWPAIVASRELLK